ncbi:MAG: GNAT family N-acetyltransferase [Dokdonella sp.]|uniref:GNAT family N-acetyltransferase n=1 Tax=Dokdonella sp. TaxID=2291710 RepID=UPI0025C6952F|nr:GNAT family N-acetyltransferase [Dokdonella sp.]MBX3699996.1 GNAT family N-acetyltransferase [Dokdonella sp.]
MIELRTFVGGAVQPHLDAVAALRIAVFRDWPYLYAGDAAYEREYLATYARSPRSVFVLAFDRARVVGASTGIPLVDEMAAIREPFATLAVAADRIFYCGESVLLADYRGRGLGHRFFDEREAHARRLGGVTHAAFCSVERDAADPRRAPGYRGNEAFWRKRGYAPLPGVRCSLDWPEVERGSLPHWLQFWWRELEAT